MKFDLSGYALCLIPKTALAVDALSPSAESTCFVYLARTQEEVLRVLNAVALTGGEIVQPATRRHWGMAGHLETWTATLLRWTTKTFGCSIWATA